MIDLPEPVLPDGTKIPSGDTAAVLRTFDVVFPGSAKPKGISVLLSRLMSHRKQRADEAELLDHLDTLKKAQLIAESGHPGPSIRMPRLPDLPGLRQASDIYASDDPRPGERCFVATDMGAKAARFLNAENTPRALWVLGRERATDQVILACHPVAQTLPCIDAMCSLLSLQEVKAALTNAERQGFLVKGTVDVWAATSQGEGRGHELTKELSERWARKLQSPVAVPQPAMLLDPVPLNFLRDEKLKAVIERDLLELDRVRAAGADKAVLLLSGSILEAVLLDVLGRNKGVAQSLLPKGKKHWPDDASLPVLIGIAQAVRVRLPDGSTATILSPTVTPLAHGLTDHRDLIHPQAEIRERIHVDRTTGEAMLHLIRVVLRDLARASASGVFDAYERGDSV